MAFVQQFVLSINCNASGDFSGKLPPGGSQLNGEIKDITLVVPAVNGVSNAAVEIVNSQTGATILFASGISNTTSWHPQQQACDSNGTPIVGSFLDFCAAFPILNIDVTGAGAGATGTLLLNIG
jgi:hypothetical protein